MIVDIKPWWSDLAERERHVIFYGGIVLAIFLVYLLIWSPLTDAVAKQKESVRSQRTALHYLQGAAVEVQTLRAQGIGVAPARHANILTVAEQTVSENQLQASLKQVQQPQPNEVQLTFQAVPFDQLLNWLQHLVMTQGFSVTEFTAKRSGTAGIATVSLTLKAG